MNDYILSPMNERQKFIAIMSFKYNNRGITINDAVIDTECK